MTRNILVASLATALLAGCAYAPGSRSPEEGTAGSVVTRDQWGNPISSTATIRDEVYRPVQVVPAAPTVATVAPATVYYDMYGNPVAVAPGAVVAYPR